MKIFEANNEHAKVNIRKVAELIEELGGKPFVHNETEVLGFVEEAMAKGRYMAFLAADENGKVVGLITRRTSTSGPTKGEVGL